MVHPTLGMFDSARCCLSLDILIENVALKDGSSKQGNAMRAAVGSKSVVASILFMNGHVNAEY